MRVQFVSLESLLKLDEALAILVKLGLELSQLRKLHGLVVLRRGVSQNRPNYKSSSVETIDKQSSFQT